VRELALKDLWLVALNSGEGLAVLDAARNLEANPAILDAEPDVAFTPDPDAINPTDELYSGQWHLSRVKASDAWQDLRDANPAGVNPGDAGDLTFGSAEIVIGVMDTGVKSRTNADGTVTAAHPEFQGNVSNGQAKVVQFFDFGSMVANCNSPETAFTDGYHGSGCAGVITARANNPSGVGTEEEGGAGIAPNCRMVVAQGPNPCTETEFSDLYLWLAGLNAGNTDPNFPAVLAHGADVITCSFGGHAPNIWPISTLVDTTFNTITDDARGGLGTLMFFSSGNGYNGSFWTLRPYASHGRTFGIGASTNGDVKADYSNWGDGLDLCAPSDGGTKKITTTTIPGKGNLTGHTGGGLDYINTFGGTSAATPVAAGVAALVLSMDPTLTHQEVRTILTKTAKQIDYGNTDADGHWRDLDGDGVNEYSSWYGYGMVDAARAVCVANNTISVDSAVQFVDVPEGEAAIRPVVIHVKGWRPRTFQVTAGPTGSFALHAGASATSAGSYECAASEVYIWLRYTGTTAGDTTTGSVTVTCMETGRHWDVAISANTIAMPKTALVLALDRSGSMDDPAGDGRLKIQLVRDSAAVVPSLCEHTTGVGAVRWDTDANVAGAMHVQEAGDEIGGAGRTGLATFVAGHTTNVAGLTAIGDAVEAAQSLLDSTSGYDVKAMCILTDGNETASKYIADLTSDELHSRIFAIGVGTPENIDPASLAALTGAHKGYLLMTGDIGTDDTFLLTKYFQQILAGVTNTDIVVDPGGWIAPGAHVRLPFPVNETDRQVDAIVFCSAPWVLRFGIEPPDGHTFGPGQAHTIDARYVTGPGSAYYRLQMPCSIVGPQDPGRPWYARISIDPKEWDRYMAQAKEHQTGSAINGVRYTFTTQARSSLRMEVSVTQSSNEPGATAWLRAALLEYDYPLGPEADVWAEIVSPKGDAATIPLVRTNPGVYRTSIAATESGAWRVTVKAKGQTTRGNPFLREAIRSIAVWQGGDRPGPQTRSSACCRLLQCLCSGKVVDPDTLHKWGIDLEALCACLRRKRRIGEGC
jgi:hypothetical protein